MLFAPPLLTLYASGSLLGLPAVYAAPLVAWLGFIALVALAGRGGGEGR